MAFPDPDPALDGNVGMVFAFVSRPAINITVSHIAARPLLPKPSKPTNQHWLASY